MLLNYLNTWRRDEVALPKIFIVGTQKAATSSLHRYLIQHPQIQAGRKKELAFFSMNYDKGKRFYKQQFPFSINKLFIDATPHYLYHDSVPARIKETIGGAAKIIITVRNPIDRAYSAWSMYKKMAQDEKLVQRFKKIEERDTTMRLYSKLYLEDYPSFEVAIQREIEWIENQEPIIEPSFIRRGFYMEQIEHWLKYFPRSHFFFIDSKDLSNPERGHQILYKLEEFIGVEQGKLQHIDLSLYNKGSYSKGEISRTLQVKLQELFSKKNEGLAALTDLDLDWNTTSITSRKLIL